MQDLLRISKVQRMLYMRLFLCMNSYPGVGEETFHDQLLYSPMSNAPGGALLASANM